MGLIPDDIIGQVIERSDIVEVVSSYVPLKKAGRSFRGLSPFNNEKTPSFFVNPDKQIFHCFSSGAGGNVITFVMKLEHLEFPEAVRFLADRAGVIIPEDNKHASNTKNLVSQIININQLAVNTFHKQLLSDKTPEADSAREYLKKRNISLETVKKFQLGFARNQWDSLKDLLARENNPLSLIEKAGLIISRESKEGYYDRFRNRIIFPIFDVRNRCVAFGARTMDTDAKQTAKYINSPETPCYTKGQHLYGLHLAKQNIIQEDFVIIVEGYLDCLMPFQVGIGNVVASLGTALTVEQIRLIRRYTKNIVLLFDTDKAGEAAMFRSLDVLIEEGMNVKVVSLAEGEDPDSFIRQFGVEAFRERIKDSQTLFDYKLSKLNKRYNVEQVEGKAKVADDMMRSIVKYNNAVIRSGYISQLAKRLSISEQALAIELNKLALNFQERKPEKTIVPQKLDQEIQSIEYCLLKILLSSPEFQSIARNEIELTDLESPAVREILERIFRDEQRPEEFSVPRLLNHFEDEKIQQLITKAVSDPVEDLTNPKKMLEDCLFRLKDKRKRKYRQELRRKMSEAETEGNSQELNHLKELFNQSIKG